MRQEGPVVLRQEGPVVLRQEGPVVLRQEGPVVSGRRDRSEEAAVGGPAGELVAARELKLSQDG